jgi:hypothetical protein
MEIQEDVHLASGMHNTSFAPENFYMHLTGRGSCEKIKSSSSSASTPYIRKHFRVLQKCEKKIMS